MNNPLVRFFRYFGNTIERAVLRRHLEKHRALSIVEKVKERRLSYLSVKKFVQISKVISEIGQKNIAGTFIEAGCALGGSTIVIAKLRPEGASFNVYDVFDMIPPPTSDDPEDVIQRYETIVKGDSTGIGGDQYYGYKDDLLSEVKSNLAEFCSNSEINNLHLIKGLLQDTLEVNEPVAFAHIDVDWYEPVKVCLNRIGPNLTVGGSVILDDYYDWGGCRKAVDEYLKETPYKFEVNGDYGNLRLTKIS